MKNENEMKKKMRGGVFSKNIWERASEEMKTGMYLS